MNQTISEADIAAASAENTPPEQLQQLANHSPELAQLVAQNPAAPSELLAKLASSKDPTTRARVAANPNTPTEILLKLGAEFPQQLLENPMWDLILLENPRLAETIPIASLISIVKLQSEKIPISFLETVLLKVNEYKYPDVLTAVALNPRTPPHIFRQLGEDQNYPSIEKAILSLMAQDSPPIWLINKLLKSTNQDLADAAKLHIISAGEMSNGWHQQAQTLIDTYFNLFISQQQSKTGKIVKRYDRNYCGLLDLGLWLDFPDFIIKRLAEQGSWEIQLAIAQNPFTPASILADIATAADEIIRSSLASNYKLPPNLLDNLAQDESDLVRQAVASNPKTPANLLAQLGAELDINIRCAVAANPNTPLPVIESLAKSDNQRLALPLLSNPNTPPIIQFQLVANMSNLKDLWAVNPYTSPDFLATKADDNYHNERVRQKLALHPNTPQSILWRLATDKDEQVRRNLVDNPRIPLDILKSLLRDHSSTVSLAAVQRYLQLHPESLPTVIQQSAKHYPPSLSRFLMLVHPQNHPETLAAYCRSPMWIERYAIARHHQTAKETLEILAEDGNRIVRATAKENLNSRI
ncbi:MAG: DUF2336 domain-containing protein [Oscillatoriaceae cyanobacterium]